MSVASLVQELRATTEWEVEAGGLRWRLRRPSSSAFLQAGGDGLLVLLPRVVQQESKEAAAAELQRIAMSPEGMTAQVRRCEALVAAAVMGVARPEEGFERVQVVLADEDAVEPHHLPISALPAAIVRALATSIETDAAGARLRGLLR